MTVTADQLSAALAASQEPQAAPEVGAVLYRGAPIRIEHDEGGTGFLGLALPFMALSALAGAGGAIGKMLGRKLYSSLSSHDRRVVENMQRHGASQAEIKRYASAAVSRVNSHRPYTSSGHGPSAPIMTVPHPRQVNNQAFAFQRRFQAPQGGHFRQLPIPPVAPPYSLAAPGLQHQPGSLPARGARGGQDIRRIMEQSYNRGNGDWDPSWGDVGDVAAAVEDLSNSVQADYDRGLQAASSTAASGSLTGTRDLLRRIQSPATPVAELQGMADGLGTQSSGQVGDITNGLLNRVVDLAFAVAEAQVHPSVVSDFLNGVVHMLRGEAERRVETVHTARGPILAIDADALEQQLPAVVEQSELGQEIAEGVQAMMQLQQLSEGASGDITDSVLSAVSKVPLIGALGRGLQSLRTTGERASSALRANVDLDTSWVDEIARVSPNPLLSTVQGQARDVLMRTTYNSGQFLAPGVVYPRQTIAARTAADMHKSHSEVDAITIQLGGGAWWLPYYDATTGAISMPRGALIPIIFDGPGGETGQRTDGFLVDTYSVVTGETYATPMYIMIPTRTLACRSGGEAIASLGSSLYMRFLCGATAPAATIPTFGFTFSGLTDAAGAVSTQLAESWQAAQVVTNPRQGTSSPATGNQQWVSLPDPFCLSMATGKLEGGDSFIIVRVFPLAVGAGPGFAVTADRPVMVLHFFDQAYAESIFLSQGFVGRDVAAVTWKSSAQAVLGRMLAEVFAAQSSGLISRPPRPNIGSVQNSISKRVI